jgi:hypothetical protein
LLKIEVNSCRAEFSRSLLFELAFIPEAVFCEAFALLVAFCSEEPLLFEPCVAPGPVSTLPASPVPLLLALPTVLLFELLVAWPSERPTRIPFPRVRSVHWWRFPLYPLCSLYGSCSFSTPWPHSDLGRGPFHHWLRGPVRKTPPAVLPFCSPEPLPSSGRDQVPNTGVPISTC